MTSDPHGEPQDDESAHLFIVRYDDDTERKRVEYLFNNWEDGDIENPSGLVRIARDADHDALYEQLISKVPEEQVSSYRLDAIEPDVTPETAVVEQTIHTAGEAVETFVEYMLSKKKAVLQSAAQNEYEVYTKKGRADVSYRLTTDDGTSTVTIRITGYPPAPDFLAEYFRTELESYAASQA